MKSMLRKGMSMLCALAAIVMLMGILPLAAQEQETATTSILQSQQAASAIEAPQSTELTLSAEKTPGAATATTDDKAAAQPSSGETTAPASKPAATVAPEDFNKFKVLIIPYAWFATTSTSMTVRDRTVNATVTPGEAAKYLDAAFAARLEASQGHIGGFIDVNSLRLADTVTPNYRNVTMGFTSGINTYALFYRFSGTPVFDIYAGARTYNFKTDLTIAPGRIFPGRTISRDNSWGDALIGVRMNAPLSKNLGFIVDADVGGGGNTNSWQAEGLIDWKLSSSFSLQGGYKALYFQNTYDTANINNVSVKSNMYGPILKLQFGF
jgi:hypothetical protein